jgi:hypothetical protein
MIVRACEWCASPLKVYECILKVTARAQQIYLKKKDWGNNYWLIMYVPFHKGIMELIYRVEDH